jgi:hypothetical protein
MEQRWNNNARVKLKDFGENLSQSTTDFTWTDLGVNLVICSEMPMTTCLHYGTAQKTRSYKYKTHILL